MMPMATQLCVWTGSTNIIGWHVRNHVGINIIIHLWKIKIKYIHFAIVWQRCKILGTRKISIFQQYLYNGVILDKHIPFYEMYLIRLMAHPQCKSLWNSWMCNTKEREGNNLAPIQANETKEKFLRSLHQE